jgi:CRP/FNR family cyclic AMP-dependent transcriptional regulator
MSAPTPAPKTKVLSPGTYLFREGEASKSLFLIKRGSVGIRKAKGSVFVELARLYSNEVVGELSFFDRHPRSASAISLTEVEVLEITFDSLEKIYQGVPDYLKTIMASVADRLRKADDQIRRLQKETVEETGNVDSTESDTPSAADVLAATADIDVSDAEGDEINLDDESDEKT